MTPPHSSGAAARSSKPSREAEGEVGADGDPGGVPAVAVPARELRRPGRGSRGPSRQNATRPAGRGEPRHAGPLTHRPARDVAAHRLHAANDLVTRHDRQPPSLEIALDQLEVGSADGAGDDLEDELIRRRLGIGELDELQWRRGRRGRRVKLKSEHRTTVPQIDRDRPSARAAAPTRDRAGRPLSLMTAGRCRRSIEGRS